MTLRAGDGTTCAAIKDLLHTAASASPLVILVDGVPSMPDIEVGANGVGLVISITSQPKPPKKAKCWGEWCWAG